MNVGHKLYALYFYRIQVNFTGLANVKCFPIFDLITKRNYGTEFCAAPLTASFLHLTLIDTHRIQRSPW